jgi:OmpA-OmpF porin, OOP family
MKTYTFSFLFAVCTFFLQGQNVFHYNFNGTMNETDGAGPSLTVLGNTGIFVLDTLNEISGRTKTVYRFEANSGFQFDNLAAGNFQDSTYTIELYFKFDNLSSWKRVADWKNRKTDRGAYVFNGQLNFYNYVYSGQAPVVVDEYTYYIITRDKATKKVLIYTDAAVQIDFIDYNGDGVVDSDHVLNFFFDDLQVPNEASSGAVALLNLYNYVLDSATIVQNWNNLNSEVFGMQDRGKANTSISICPNPANESTTIDLSGFKNDGVVGVSVRDMMGSTVYTAKITGGSSHVIRLNTVELPSGIYIVQAESGTKITAQKLVIRR